MQKKNDNNNDGDDDDDNRKYALMQAKIWKDKVSFLVSVLLLQEYVANYFLAEISVTLNYKKLLLHNRRNC